VTLEPVLYRDQLVALVGPERFHLIAPWLQDQPGDDPDVRFVLFMCQFREQVERGALPGPFSSERAELWARCVLIDPAQLRARWNRSDAALAEHFGVPVDQVAAAREDLRR
jgi:hypothetical protein